MQEPSKMELKLKKVKPIQFKYFLLERTNSILHKIKLSKLYRENKREQLNLTR